MRRKLIPFVVLLCTAPVLLYPRLVVAQIAPPPALSYGGTSSSVGQLPSGNVGAPTTVYSTPVTSDPGLFSTGSMPDPSSVWGTSNLDPITSGGITTAGGVNPYGTNNGNIGGIIQNATPILSGLANGGGLTSVLPGAASILGQYLPAGSSQYLNSALPILSGLMSGNFNPSSVLSAGMPYLQGVLSPSQLGILGSATPLLGSLLSGNINAGSLISGVGGIVGNLLGGSGGSIFGTASGVLGGLFGGGGGSTFSLSEPLSSVFTDPGTISSQIFGINSAADGSATANTNTVLAQTGTVLCLYNLNCRQSNPTAYRSLYTDSTGSMGFSDPNEVRGKIAELSQSGVMPDAFASRTNSEQNNYYVGNYSDREIARAKSVSVLSKTGQTAQKQAIAAAQKTAQTLTQLSDQCAKTSKSSQELIRCDMQINTAVPSFQAAQIALETNAQIDRNFHTTVLGNISSSIDGLNRSQDVDRGAVSARLMREATMNVPVTGKQ